MPWFMYIYLAHFTSTLSMSSRDLKIGLIENSRSSNYLSHVDRKKKISIYSVNLSKLTIKSMFSSPSTSNYPFEKINRTLSPFYILGRITEYFGPRYILSPLNDVHWYTNFLFQLPSPNRTRMEGERREKYRSQSVENDDIEGGIEVLESLIPRLGNLDLSSTPPSTSIRLVRNYLELGFRF